MMKSKPKQPPKKACTQIDPEFEEFVQDGWVVVKKQKVTILIPSLPVIEQCTIPRVATKEVNHTTTPQPDPPVTKQCTIPPIATKEVSRITPPQPDPLVTEQFTIPPIATKDVDHITPPQPDPPVTKQCTIPPIAIKEVNRVTPSQPDPPVIEHCTIPPIATKEVNHITPPQPDPPVIMPLATTKPVTTFSNPPPKLNNIPKPRNLHNGEPSCRRTHKICSASKARNHCGNLFNGHMLVNPKMRALNLERKLRRAGGLNRWLVSIGLGQFVKIFKCKRVGKMQLVNLTMKKLKDMGADAVGPRRKLMHAIDCLWFNFFDNNIDHEAWHANIFFAKRLCIGHIKHQRIYNKVAVARKPNVSKAYSVFPHWSYLIFDHLLCEK
ncbi:hypothetical protein QVD17_36389 [Tagetes erecta]|uniref:SAM domain-containing protein n=1 Tax=Tagetes erecta TaxID=13708 RepID=A0AAD8NBV0_TARER|nr:hypothetical protein QVD17_36389 [Tagetes erecta]